MILATITAPTLSMIFAAFMRQDMAPNRPLHWPRQGNTLLPRWVTLLFFAPSCLLIGWMVNTGYFYDGLNFTRPDPIALAFAALCGLVPATLGWRP